MQTQIKPHIHTKDDYLDRREREAQYERECAREEALAAERAEEDAYCARAAQSLARGESEEQFEIAEEAMQAAQYRVTDRLNADVLDLFARCAPRRFEDETLSEFLERRAA